MQRHSIERLVLIGSVCLLILLLGGKSSADPGPGPLVPPGAVGRVADDRFATPTGQILTPAGEQTFLPGMRPQGLALRGDGKLLAVAGNREVLLLLDPESGELRQTVPLSYITTEKRLSPSTNSATFSKAPAGEGETNSYKLVTVTNRAQLSFTGLAFSPDGGHLYLSAANGTVWQFTLVEDQVVGRPVLLSLPETESKKRRNDIPSGLGFSEDGQRLYVVGNLGNQLHELDTVTGHILRSFDTGLAPYDVVVARQRAYVSNLGGRRPAKGDLTALAGLGTRVRVDRIRDIASESSVTVIDLASGAVGPEILLEQHASALALSPDKRFVVAANTGSDTLSVIDTVTDRVVERIFTRISPADLFGAQPNALVFDGNGRRLYVCNGTQNAVGVIEFEPERRASRMLGLIPVGWFPAAIQFNARTKTLYVANLKGVGATRNFKPGEKIKFNDKEFFGSITQLEAPSKPRLSVLTREVLQNMRYPRLAETRLPARAGVPARPVPERTGEASLLKHVIYVIKENRTYDQVLGDMPEGNGDRSLCTFGEEYTPNLHKIAREFVLLDNTYCAGICSADGHQWTDSGLANEHVERQLTSGNPRSYAGGKGEDAVDALSWASSGFIWDNALAHGKTFRNYGEWMVTECGWSDRKKKDKIMWADYWGAFHTNRSAVRVQSRAQIRTLRHHSDTNSVGWDLKVPDVMRAAEFIRELKQFETNGGFPNLVLLFLPNDHTGGERTDYPTPGSQVADNDLAMGQVLEALTHSRFWPETCLVAIEDDPQAGWDHISGYRTTCYVASPYTPRKRTIGTQYNQLSVLRTIELILGLPPMNQLDACATPMFDCFSGPLDLTPFDSVPNRFPLDKITPEPKKVADRRHRADITASNRLALDVPDRCPEDVLNRILWRAMKGGETPYPEWAVTPEADDD